MMFRLSIQVYQCHWDTCVFWTAHVNVSFMGRIKHGSKKKIHVRCNYCLLCQKPVDIKSTSASELESCFDNARKTTNTISSFVIYYSHMELSYLPRWFIHLPCHLICLSFCWLISPDCVERNELLTSLDRLSVCPVGVVVAIVSENSNNNNNNILCASSALA